MSGARCLWDLAGSASAALGSAGRMRAPLSTARLECSPGARKDSSPNTQ